MSKHFILLSSLCPKSLSISEGRIHLMHVKEIAAQVSSSTFHVLDTTLMLPNVDYLKICREGDLNNFDTDVPPSSESTNSAAESGWQNLRSPISSSALSRSSTSEAEAGMPLVWIERARGIHHKSESSSGPYFRLSDELSREPPTPFCAMVEQNISTFKCTYHFGKLDNFFYN